MDLKKDYFADTEIYSLLENGGIDANQTVESFLYELLSLYEIVQDGKTLSNALIDDWGIFADESSLANVLNDINAPLKSDSHVRYIAEYRGYLQAWENVKVEVKSKTRFFCHLDEVIDVLDDFDIDNDCKLLFKGNIFYRARVHHKDEQTFDTTEMGCPSEPCLASPGRANPRGISYLYLCCDGDTPFYEVRPYYLDRVDIGEFLIVEDNVKIVDFTENINLFNVFCNEGEDSFRKKVKRRVLFDSISSDLSTPLRSFDSEIEYIPTQYICEYFKDIGADGIMFKSSVRGSGKNLVLFYPEKATCVNVYPYEVNKITIETKDIQ